jgi:hypothetical protein
VPEVARIALSQLVLWYDAARIQTWPALLAQVPQDLQLPSPTEFGRRFATDRQTDPRHSAAEKVTRNLSGLELTNDRLLLRGVGLLDRVAGRRYSLSEQAKALVAAYRSDRKGLEWIKILARLLLTREPRTRVLIGLLSTEGARLFFEQSEWFGGSLRKATLEIEGQEALRPFWDKADGTRSLRNAICERSWWALGSWRDQEALEGYEDCMFTGQTKENFSLHDIGLALHASCEVLLALGLFNIRGGECSLDPHMARQQLGDDLAAEFGWVGSVDSVEGPGLTQILTKILPDLRLDTGFVVASELRERLRAEGFGDPDRAIGELEREGAIQIYAEDYGQSRHGVGLYDDPRKQLVKIRIVAEGTRA